VKPNAAPYGSWRSPVTSDLIVSETVGLGQVVLDGSDTYWVEMRPAEGGRCVVVRQSADGQTVDVTPPPFSARTLVHEYGGGAFLVDRGTVYFSNFADQRLYRQEPASEPYPISPEGEMRYADGAIDRRRHRIICVREDHTAAGRQPVNTLIGLELRTGADGRVLVSGNDFYSSPRLSPDGARLAWLTWNHPNMPWDGTELWVAQIEDDGSLGHARRVAGGPEESIFQPEWSPDGTLHFVSDRTGWWNLYRWRDEQVEPLCPMEAEFGAPQWLFGMSTYAIESPQRIICACGDKGKWRLASIESETGRFQEIETPYTSIGFLCATPGSVAFLAGSPTETLSVVRLDLATRRLDVLRRSSAVVIDPEFLSSPQAIEFPTESGLTAHAFFYPPMNGEYQAPPDERPPLLVISHGGPTGATSGTLNPMIQYWTSRGIAVADVNYGGSTGYGRAYRQRLRNKWGIVDVDDCVNAARWLVERDLVDEKRLAIRGSSAGGYTTLSALTFRDLFKAGASHFGVSDLEALATETHKFESRYLDGLIGPYPERRDIYLERSPIHSLERLSCPVILFQGLDDKIVPPNQAEMMAEALRAKGLPVAHLTFEGEQHGFRRAENIRRTLDAELYFYSRIFGFALADPVEPVSIDNLPDEAVHRKEEYENE